MASIFSFPPEFHNSRKQVSKRINAEAIKPSKVITVDPTLQSGVIEGGDSSDGSHLQYNVTLFSCDCDSYKRERGLPCKHMYRLAIELGKFPRLPEGDHDAEQEFLDEDIAMWSAAFSDGKISPAVYVTVAAAFEKAGSIKPRKK